MLKKLGILILLSFSPALFAGYDLFQFQDLKKEQQFSLQAIADCVKGPTETPPAYKTNCIKLTNLSLGFQQRYSESSGAKITLSPLINRNASLKNSPLNYTRQSDPLLVVENFAFLYTLLSSVEVSLETYQGFRFYPNTSGLSLASRFYDKGWDQLALSLDGHLSALDLLSFRLSIGNGEGELLSSHNKQSFFAFEGSAQIVPSVFFVGGLSFNANNSGALGYFDDKRALFQSCGIVKAMGSSGYSTRRLMAGIVLDGTWPLARGLKSGFGWQQTMKQDLDASSDDFINQGDLFGCQRLDEDRFFIKDGTHAQENILDKTVMNFNISYLLMDRAFIGFDYERKLLNSRLPVFKTCTSVDSGNCMSIKDAGHNLGLTGYTVGLGSSFGDGLVASFEYNVKSYDSDYEKFYFQARNDRRRSQHLFNARLSYAWR